MAVAFVVYEISSGLTVYTGVDPFGAEMQRPHLAEGLAVMDVPIEAIKPGGTLDLAPVRQVLVAKIDYEAEQARLPFMTAGSGQAMTYTYKADEARAWTADNTAATPFLSAEADARGIKLSDLIAEVLKAIAEWTRVGAIIEAKRIGAKEALAKADTLPLLAAASTVDWGIPPPPVA